MSEKTYQVRMTEEQHKAIKLASILSHMTINEFFIKAAEEHASRYVPQNEKG